MRSDSAASNRREALLSQWMRDYGDALLRACFLITGDLPGSRAAVRAAFIQAFEEMDAFQPLHSDLARLLRFALDNARSDAHEARVPACPNPLLRRIASLPSAPKRAAVLCFYLDLSVSEAAWVLEISEAHLRRLLEDARGRLYPL